MKIFLIILMSAAAIGQLNNAIAAFMMDLPWLGLTMIGGGFAFVYILIDIILWYPSRK